MDGVDAVQWGIDFGLAA